MLLNNHLDDANGTKTFEGAKRRLDKFSGLIGDCATVIVHRADGLFVPVAFLREGHTQAAFALAHAGIFVTN